MIKSFGKFYRQPVQSDEEGRKFYPYKNADGEDFHIDVAMKQAVYDGPDFVSAEYPYYAAVTENGVIRVVSNEPSRAQPDGDEYFIAMDEEYAPGMIYDPKSNTISDAPYNPEADGPTDLAQLKVYVLRKGQMEAFEQALRASRAGNADELRIYWAHAGMMGHDHPLVAYAAKFFGFPKAKTTEFFKELRETK